MTPWEKVGAELDALEHEIHALISIAFENGKQRLTTYAVEPGGRDARAEDGHSPIGKIEITRPKKT